MSASMVGIQLPEKTSMSLLSIDLWYHGHRNQIILVSYLKDPEMLLVTAVEQ
jgi:hypothetical protein